MFFTEDWFTNNIPIWNKQLAHLKNKPITVLEIGVFEGRSSIWMLQHLLKHPKAKLYCIDNWLHHGDHNKHVYETFLKNIEPYKDKVVILQGYSADMLRNLKVQFDFIYIDADRHSQHVLEDAVLSFPLLKKHGILIFDDYTHNKEHDINCPRPGIDAFCNIYARYLKVLYMKWQVVIEKRNTPLKKTPCYSEYYKEPNKTPTIYKTI